MIVLKNISEQLRATLYPNSNNYVLTTYVDHNNITGVYNQGQNITTPSYTIDGEALFTTPGTYTWTAPAGVTSVSAVAIGGGGGGGNPWTSWPSPGDQTYGGGGGGLGWKNNITVVPGQSYTVVVGAGGTGVNSETGGGDSYFINTATVRGGGGKNGKAPEHAPGAYIGLGGDYTGDGGGNGGSGNTVSGQATGGGAGGYSGNGGSGGNITTATAGSGGGGGGAAAVSGGGGGVGLYGEESNGFKGGASGGGGGGSNGERGIRDDNNDRDGGEGGKYGGGGGASIGVYNGYYQESGGQGANGAVRIVWGSGVSFPSNAGYIVTLLSGPPANTTRTVKSIYYNSTTETSGFSIQFFFKDTNNIQYKLYNGYKNSDSTLYFDGNKWHLLELGRPVQSIGLPNTLPKLVERFTTSGISYGHMAGYKFLMYKLWGAGGGGGGGAYGTTNVARHGGAGGGGGACLQGVMHRDNAPTSFYNDDLTIIVGAGGTGGAGAGTTVGPGQAGTAGGDTYFDTGFGPSNIIAYGGGGGAAGTNAAAATSGGGGGGTASAGATGTTTAAAGGRPGTAASTGVAGGTGASSTITATVAGTVATLCAEYGGAAGAGQPATASGGSSGGSSLFGGGGGGHGACQSSTQTLLAAGQGGNSNSYVAGGSAGGTNLYLGIFGGSGGADSTVSGFNSYVSGIAIQSDGKIVVGGDFTICNRTLQNRITRLNSDGTRDTGFTIGTGFNGYVSGIAIQSDGKIVVVGAFTSYDGTTQNYITRLNSDSTRDTGFTIGTGFNGFVYSTHIQTDGKIVVGGPFTSYNGTTQNYITRLNSDGTRDTGFSIGTGFNGIVSGTAIQSDGKILVGGVFTSYNGTIQNGITRLNSDGTRDTGFSIGTGFNGGVESIAIQSDGKIVVGGDFTSYNGTTQNYITRLNSDGTRDTGFSIGTGFNSTVRSIAIQSDSKILVGGDFTSYNGTTQNYITRLNSDGTRDTGFSIGTGFNSTVRSIAIQSDSKILVGGDFTSYNGTIQNGITRLNSDGTRDTIFYNIDSINGGAGGGGGSGGSSGNATVGAATDGGRGGHGYAILYWW